MLVVAAASAVTLTACSKNTPTSPTTTTTTTTSTVAAPTNFETFEGVVSVNGSNFYSFSVSQYGTVNITLTSVSGAYVPGTVSMGLSLGQPSGETCVDTTGVEARAASAPQITGAYTPGVYCARIYDQGNLYAPANFSISIEYP